jgi:DNA-binding MarR family transcriptional regulator
MAPHLQGGALLFGPVRGRPLWRAERAIAYKKYFCKFDVYTYICIVKLENALLSTKFSSEVQKASLNVLYSAWWLKSITSKELKDFDLTHEQYNVLRILKGKYPDQLCVKDIARRMIEKSSNVPRIIDRLEIKKLVKRTVSESDKRETLITITKSGLSILESSTSKLNKLHGCMQNLTEKEALQLNQLLEKMRQKETD